MSKAINKYKLTVYVVSLGVSACHGGLAHLVQ